MGAVKRHANGIMPRCQKTGEPQCMGTRTGFSRARQGPNTETFSACVTHGMLGQRQSLKLGDTLEVRDPLH